MRKLEKAQVDLRDVVDAIHRDNTEGYEKCRDVIILKQLASGEYQPVDERVKIRDLAVTRHCFFH